MTYSAVESASPHAPIAHQPEFSHSLQSSHLEPIVYSGHALLRAVVESWVDGILILPEQGQWVEANEAARQVCGQLMKAQGSAQSHYSSRQDAVPKVIWKACQELIQSRKTFPHQPVVVESEINVDGLALRVRVRWFGVEETDRPYLMVILEDRHQSNLQRAIAEVDQFHLSPREAEVWLLHRCGYRYKEIAQELYICADTVKKHLRSIRAKRQCVKLS